MGIQPLTSEELKEVAEFGMHTATPLWFYTLREAQERADGKHLGPVGGRLVAEVLVGLLVGDPLSFVRCHPRWCPTLGQKGEFGMADLLRTAGVVQDTEPAMAY